MCGRFAQKTEPKKLAKKFAVVVPAALLEHEPRYNIAPSSLVPVLRIPASGSPAVLETLQWGLVPSWAKDPSIGFQLSTARAETAAVKPSFRSAFKSRRCLVPVDGYYEWNQETKPKQPHYYFMKDGEPFCLAGLWETWAPRDPQAPPLQTFTLLTTGPNALAAKVHDRMPVILEEKDFAFWLDPDNHDVEGLVKLLVPFDPGRMDSYPVSTFVSNARHEGPQCIQEIKLP